MTALVLARRFARSRSLRASTLIAFVAAAVVTALFVVLQAQTLTGDQIAERDLGRHGAFAGFGVGSVGPGSDARERLLGRVAPVAGQHADVALVATDFTASQLTGEGVTLTEMAWHPRPFPAKFALQTGRWPQRPGEVAILNPAGDTPSPERLSAYGDRVRLTVVGTVDDRFSRSVGLLAAPGTWAAMSPQLGKTNPILRAQPVLYWDGARPDAVLAELAGGLREVLDDDVPAQLAAAVRDTHTDRAALAARSGKSWIDEAPTGYTIPSLLLPLLAALLIFTGNARRLTPAVTTMTSVGMPRRVALAGVGIAVTGWCLVATLAGVAAGFGAGLGTAHLLSALLGLPEPAIPDPVAPGARLLLMTLAGCAVGVCLLGGGRGLRSAPGTTSGRWRDARHLLALAAFCVAFVRLSGIDSAPQAMLVAGILTAGVLLVLPDLVPALLRRLPERSLGERLAKRQLLGDRRRAVTVVGVLAVLLGLSTGFLALFDTMQRSAGDQQYAEVLPGQVKIADRTADVVPPPAAAVEAARTVAAAGRQQPVQLRFLAQVTESGEVRAQVAAGYSPGLLLAAGSPRDVERLVGKRLNAPQARVLREGGALLWNRPAAATAGLRMARDDGTAEDVTTVPAAHLPLRRATWNDGTAGVMLAHTAERLELPTVAGAVMYTGLSPAEADAVRAAVEQAGIDPKTAATYREPEPPIPPVALVFTAVGLALVALVVTLSLARAQARALRDHLGHLIALGVPPRWVRLVVVRQHLALLALAAVLGLALGLVTAMLAAWGMPEARLTVPWTQLAVLVTAVFAAVLLATLLSSRRVTAADRSPAGG